MCTCFCAYAKKGYKAAALTINTQILSIGNITQKEYVQKLFLANQVYQRFEYFDRWHKRFSMHLATKKNQLTKLQLVNEFLSQTNEVV